MLRLRKFFLLCPTERRLLLKAAFLLSAIRVGLWLLPFQLQGRLFVRLSKLLPEYSPDPDAAVAQVAWAVETAAPYVPRATCLTRALAAKAMLASSQCPLLLHIGVAKGENGHFKAHAWLESQGRVVIGDIQPWRYTSMPSFPWDQV
jgi:hypothetical protein